MFNQAKALHKAKKLQDKIKKQQEAIFHNEESGEDSVLIRGDKKIEKIVIDGEERKDIKDLLNDGFKKLDKKLEKKMKDQAGDVMEMLGF